MLPIISKSIIFFYGFWQKLVGSIIYLAAYTGLTYALYITFVGAYATYHTYHLYPKQKTFESLTFDE